jgi:hypothetical protein
MLTPEKLISTPDREKKNILKTTYYFLWLQCKLALNFLTFSDQKYYLQ